MAIGKARSNKRSSGTSYASTVTTVVFVALFVLGAWMLTSNSVGSPQTTTRTATATAAYSSSHNTKLTTKIPVFKDNPGDLPEDAIKPDELTRHEDYKNHKSQDEQSDDSTDVETSGGTTIELGSNDNDNDNDNNKQDQETDRGAAESDNVDHQESQEENGAAENNNANEQVSGQENGSSIEEHPEDLQGKISVEEQMKEKEGETQMSEDSSMNQNQQAEEITMDNQSVSKQINSESEEESQKVKDDGEIHGKPEARESKVGEENQKDTQVAISDDEQEHRMEQEQQQEEEQVQQHEEEEQVQQHEEEEEEAQQENHAAISHDQIQHDEAPIESSVSIEDKSSHETTEETNTQFENQQAEHESIENEIDPNQITQTEKVSKSNRGDSFPGGESSGIPKESKESKKSWSTQADQSENQKERRKGASEDQDESIYGYTWQLCNVTAGTDYIPCLDNEKALRKLSSRKHYEHRERHCPEEAPTCLVPLPHGYKKPVEWPQSREKIWYHNVPHTKLAEVKGHQNWVKVTGEFLTFPGGGTQFIHGALHYIDFVQEAVPEIAWGKHTRVVLDVGCGVASFGGFLFDRDVLALSFAPKDEHEAQVQFALERGIPAISAVMGSQRLPFPSRVFDLIHCARCRVPWHAEGGALLLELNRMLRPGGYFVWSATPVYQQLEEDVQIWKEMSALTVSMCWELVTIKKDKLNSVGAAIYHKPESNECYNERKLNNPPMCESDDDPNAAWYVPLQSCMHKLPVDETERGSRWPEEWPRRLQTPPYWLNRSQMGIYGKPAPDDFAADYEHWKRVVSKSYLSGLGISWSNVRNIMDMRAVYGGFAAAMKDLKVWVLNVVNIDSPDTLPIIYERGLFGIYHDWCESFSTYPRTYDLLHADHLFSRLKKRCNIAPVMAEIDRIVRPGGKLIVRDKSATVGEVENLLKSLHWEVHLTFSKNQEGILSAHKSEWRPDSYAAPS